MWWPLLRLPLLASLLTGAACWEEEQLPDNELSVLKCKALKDVDLIKTSEFKCFCYHQNSYLEWKYIWSTLQVEITSSGLFNIVYITESRNCLNPESFLSVIKCIIHKFWMPKESRKKTMTISPYGETMCFSVTPVRREFHYIVSVNRNIMDFRLFLMFVAGIFIFFYAKTLSQSRIFYYTLGTLLGIHMTLVFLLLLLRRFIPKYSSFVALMIGCWFASVYIGSQLMEDPKVLSNEHKVYSLGYIFIVGSLSFAVCYRHGPLVDPRSITLLTWTLQLLSLLLVYWGVSASLFAFTTVGLLLASKGLHYPWKAFSHLRRKMKQWLANRKPQVKLLTEEEYREQADAETSRALEELRRACRGPDFPSWLVVSRLQAPKQFADFVMGGNHLSHEEMSLHEEQYGLGGAFLEDQLFNLQTDCLAANMSQTSSSTREMVDSRDCYKRIEVF